MEIKVMEWSEMPSRQFHTFLQLTPMVLLQKLMWKISTKKNNTCANFPPVFHGSPKKNTHNPPTPFGFVNILVFFTMNPQDGGHRLSTEVGWSLETKEWSFSLSDGSSTWIDATPSVLSHLESMGIGIVGGWMAVDGHGWFFSLDFFLIPKLVPPGKTVPQLLR